MQRLEVRGAVPLAVKGLRVVDLALVLLEVNLYVCRPDNGVYKDAETCSHVILIFNLYVKNKRLSVCD
jgi:hypothetical protein